MKNDRDIPVLICVFAALLGWVMWESIPTAENVRATPRNESVSDNARPRETALGADTTPFVKGSLELNIVESVQPPVVFTRRNGVLMGQQIYTSGSGTWAVPTGVTSVSVTCWGGGAAGTNMSSGGGGGGCSVTPSYAVTPGASIPYAVGAGGAASTDDGADTSFDTSGVVAKGGKAAASSSLGGAAASGTGTTKYSGGNGGVRGGGGSAGPSSNGNNNSGNTGGAAVTDGGAGGDIDIAGFAPGGGAGGTNGFSAQPGANGKIQIDWVDPSSVSIPACATYSNQPLGNDGDLIKMLKDTASQKIGAQMVNATTGAAFTSSVTVYVTGDAGTQAIGSVGSGACTHEGNGYHTYAPAQAETNYDLVGFTFIGTGAVPATIQVATVAAPPLDAAGVRSAVGLGSANLDTQLAAIDDAIDTEVAAIKAKTDLIPAAPAAVGDCITETGVRTAVGLATANLDTQLTPLGTGFSRAVKAITLGTVDTGATTTIIPTSSLSPAAVDANQFRGQVVCFANDTTTTALRGQKTDITGSSSGGILTVNELTSTPVSGDTFTIQ